MSRGTDSQWASYNFIVDLIASTRSIHDVQSFPSFHEVLHRATSSYGDLTNSFSVLRKLAGISHALLMCLLVELDNSAARLKGRKLTDLELIGGSYRQKELIRSILRRISYLESIYDMGWKGIVPVAELIAVDFSHDISPNNYFHDGWNIQWYYHSMTRNPNAQRKLDQLKVSVQDYPHDFGGYHLEYGSFLAAMEQTFHAYASVTRNELRYPILELALHILYLNEDGQIMVNDPLETIAWASSLVRSKPKEEAVKEMSLLRVYYKYGGHALVGKLTRDLLSDIPSRISSQRNLATAVSLLMLEQKEGRLNRLTKPMFVEWVETLSRSFMRVHLSKTDHPSILINPNYIIAAHYRILREPSLRDKLAADHFMGKDAHVESILDQPELVNLWQGLGLDPDWWRRLALLESLRSSLKFGKPIRCPFKGWQFVEFEVEALENYPLKCDEKCFIRLWLNKLAKKTEIVDNDACQV